jgi:hypothetical protein
MEGLLSKGNYIMNLTPDKNPYCSSKMVSLRMGFKQLEIILAMSLYIKLQKEIGMEIIKGFHLFLFWDKG